MISVTVLSKNCGETLGATLESLKTFSEIILYDTGSIDDTLQIAATHPNLKICHGAFSGFGPTHNHASSLASNDWILSVDSDEVLSPELILEIHSLHLDPHTVYAIQRHNYFNGKWIKWCGGWHPDWVTRLYNRNATRFDSAPVHEKVIVGKLSPVRLQHPMRHTPYRDISDFLTKMQTYSTLFAQQHKHRKTPSVAKAMWHAWFAFFKSYILKKGFLGGKEGFTISVYNAHTTFYKYLKLAYQKPPKSS